jgi:hypothetical protein
VGKADAVVADRKRVAERKSHGRSRVSNGGEVLPDVDGRSVIARRYRDIVNAIVGDQGGIDHISEVRLQLVRRFAAAAVLAERMEAALARGEEIDVDQHGVLSSTLVRIAQRLGLARRAKNITPLSEYLAGKANEEDAE